jgi:hypothetical protein
MGTKHYSMYKLLSVCLVLLFPSCELDIISSHKKEKKLVDTFASIPVLNAWKEQYKFLPILECDFCEKYDCRALFEYHKVKVIVCSPEELVLNQINDYLIIRDVDLTAWSFLEFSIHRGEEIQFYKVE